MDRKTEKIYVNSLSKRDKQVLKYIEDVVEKTGKTPSYREICKECNLSSTLLVYRSIDNLEKKGYVTRTTKQVGAQKVTTTYTLNNNEIREELVGKSIKEVSKKEQESLKVAKVPFISRIKNKENILSKDNIKEYIAIPEEYGKQKYIYAFESPHSKFKEIGILGHSIIIVDTYQRYIHGDYVAYYEKEKNRVNISDYKRGTSKENIIGKVIGTYTKITY